MAKVAAMTRYPLREWGWGISEVRRYLTEQGVTIPARTDCDLCFFQRLGEWRRLARLHPDRYQEGVEYERLTGATLRTPGRDSWPTGLADLRVAFEAQPDLPGLDDIAEEETCRACTL